MEHPLLDPVKPNRYPAHCWARRRGEIWPMVGHRFAIGLLIIFLVTLGVFALAAVSPFDPLSYYLGEAYIQASAEEKQRIAESLGLNQHWWAAWWSWFTTLLSGDLGQSRVFGQPVSQVFAQRMPWSIGLSGAALTFAAVVGIAAGVFAGMRPASWFGRLATWFAVIVQSVPSFVLALGAIMVMSLGLGLFPVGGASDSRSEIQALSVLHHAILPVLVLGTSQLPWIILSVRSSVRHALESEAVRGAVSRGLSGRTILRGHLLPVSLAPVVTLLGSRLPEIIVGAVLVESVFGWPGLAAAIVRSAQQLDFPLLCSLTVATTALVLFGSLLTDALYLILDPRVSAHD